jgi:hypothetical protein
LGGFLGEGGDGWRNPDTIEFARNGIVLASLEAMKIANKIPIVKLDKQISNLESYLAKKV